MRAPPDSNKAQLIREEIQEFIVLDDQHFYWKIWGFKSQLNSLCLATCCKTNISSLLSHVCTRKLVNSFQNAWKMLQQQVFELTYGTQACLLCTVQWIRVAARQTVPWCTDRWIQGGSIGLLIDNTDRNLSYQKWNSDINPSVGRIFCLHVTHI